MKCPKCEAENREGTEFCGDCGASLLNVCPKFGAENPPDERFCAECGQSLVEPAAPSFAAAAQSAPAVPTSLANGRYQVKKFLGEGGKKKVYLAHDTVLDREPNDLRKELGTGATDAARIVSEIRETLHIEPRQGDNPEEDRYRLWQAVSDPAINRQASLKIKKEVGKIIYVK